MKHIFLIALLFHPQCFSFQHHVNNLPFSIRQVKKVNKNTLPVKRFEVLHLQRLSPLKEKRNNSNGAVVNGIQATSSSKKKRKKEKKCRDYPEFSDPMMDKKPKKSNSFFNEFGIGDLINARQLQIEYKAKSRLLESRSYARKEAFSLVNATSPPTFNDLSIPLRNDLISSIVYGSTISRCLVFAISFFSFPYLNAFVRDILTLKPEVLSSISATFLPGISFVYGSYMAFTLNSLYARQNSVQTIASKESALLASVAKGFIRLSRDDEDLAIKGCQAIVDQIMILVRKSRGEEIMKMIYSDPYSALDVVIGEIEDRLEKSQSTQNSKWNMVGNLQDRITQLSLIRAERLSVENLTLPPTHFQFIRGLTGILLVGFILSNEYQFKAPNPSVESQLLFSLLCTVYISFNLFVSDLNTLFEGFFQIRRSSIAGPLLQMKWMISKQPFGDEIYFDETFDETLTEDDLTINTPGLGEVIVRNDFLL